MTHEYTFIHTDCKYYISNYNIGFRKVSPKKGDTYEGRKFEFHSLVFLLSGEVVFSYDEFINRRFTAGDMFFMPQASAMYGTAIEDSHMLILTFNNRANTICDNCMLSRFTTIIEKVKYDFRPLPMAPVIWDFVRLMEEYIDKDVRCGYLHQLKQKELFVILQYYYTKEQITEMFYPILNRSDFRSWVLETYTIDMNMGELAGRCNMSSKSFSRKFIDKFGMTFREWMLKQKVKHIRLRLSMPDALIHDIMRDFNFSDASHFYRFCKEHFGCNPTEYKVKLMAEAAEE